MFAVALLLVAEAGVSPVSTTINGCVIKARTKCVEADLKKAKLKDANLKGENFKKVDILGVNLRGAAPTARSPTRVVKWSAIWINQRYCCCT